MPVFDFVEGVNQRETCRLGGMPELRWHDLLLPNGRPEGNGRLYAINTVDGTVKWSFETQSAGWDFVASSPIVTRDGVVIVGNNEAIRTSPFATPVTAGSWSIR